MSVPVRRFEMGCTVNYLDTFMAECGWEVSSYRGVYAVKRKGSPGRGKRMSRNKVIALLDQERVKRGLEPVQVRR